MHIVTKIFISFLCVLLILQNNYLSANNTSTSNDIETYGNRLGSISDGAEYKEKIDRIFTKYENKKETIELIYLRLQAITEQSNIQTNAAKTLLNYIIAKVNMLVVQNDMDLEALTYLSFTQDTQSVSAITSEEKEEIIGEILQLQAMMYESSSELVEPMMDMIKKQAQYTQTWNLWLEANIDLEYIGKIESDLQIDDFSLKTNFLDSQMSWIIRLFMDTEGPVWENSIDFSSFVDIVQKDGWVYLQVKDLEIGDAWNSVVQNPLEEWLKIIADQEQFVRVVKQHPEEILRIYEALESSLDLENYKDVTRKAMLIPYAKTWDKVLLAPSIEACHLLKKAKNLFDPLNWDTCSDSQYKKMLQDFQKEDIEIYMILWDMSEFWVNIQTNDLQFESKMNYKNGELLDLSLSNISWEQQLTLSYTKGSQLILDIDAGDYWSLNWDAELSMNNALRSYTLDTQFAWERNNLTLRSELKDKKIIWDFMWDIRSYDFATNSQKLSNRIRGNFSWTLDTNNNIVKLDGNMTGEDALQGTDPLDVNFQYLPWTIEAELNYDDQNELKNIDFIYTWDEENWNFESANIDIEALSREKSFDYTTYETVYSWALKDDFRSSISLKNGIIQGKTGFFDYGESVLSIEHDWKYDSTSFNSQNSFETREWWFSWDGEKITGTFDINYTHKYLSDTMNLIFEVFSGEKSIIDINLKTNTKRTDEVPEIQAPDSYIDIEEIQYNNAAESEYTG